MNRMQILQRDARRDTLVGWGRATHSLTRFSSPLPLPSRRQCIDSQLFVVPPLICVRHEPCLSLQTTMSTVSPFISKSSAVRVNTPVIATLADSSYSRGSSRLVVETVVATVVDGLYRRFCCPPDNWKRPPGRSRIKWLNTIQCDLRAYNLTLNEAADLAQNRPLWRLMST